MGHYLLQLVIDYFTFIALNLVFSSIIILLERKNPTTALAWLFFMALMPGIGFFFYILLAQNISKRKIFKYTAEESQLYASVLVAQRLAFEKGTYNFNNKELEQYKDMILFHNRISDAFFSQNNDISLFFNGYQKFAQLKTDIANANHHIHFLYYIIQNDELGHEILDLLAKRAQEGIEVRILMDFVGSRNLSKKTINMLRKSGCEVAFFFPSRFKYFNWKGNYRNHRKVVVIDGEIGYVGGYNVGNEYLGLKKRFGYWRDTHLRIRGDAVIALQIRFFLDWRTASNQNLTLATAYIKGADTNQKAAVQIVASGPDTINEQIKQGYIKMINSAKKSIYIQTPYFIPDESILEAIKIAASSGVDVRIMIPNKPDHIFVYWATYSYAGDLLPYGVKIYTYENGFLHSKSIVVDEKICSVGTCNFDIRSFKLNFEVNAFIYDSLVSYELCSQFYTDMEDCKQVTYTMYMNRSRIIKIKESVSRLFSPVL